LNIVDIGEIEVGDMDSDSMQLGVQVAIRNPHFVAIRASHISFQIQLTNHDLANGFMPSSFEIPSHGVRSVRIPLSVRFKDVQPKDFQALFEPMIRYHISGKLQIDKPVGRKGVTIDSMGTIKLPNRIIVKIHDKSIYKLVQFKPVSLENLRVLSGLGAIPIKVVNPLSFEIPLDEFEYRFATGNRILVDGKLPAPRRLQPGVNELSLPVRLHPLEGFKEVLGSLLEIQLPRLTMTGTLVLGEGDHKLTLDLYVQ
jgi:LEA14-like dessication related protein